MNKEDVKQETLKHIERVEHFMHMAYTELMFKKYRHDESKLSDAEMPFFVKYTPKLERCTYGSDEYKTYLEEMKPALDHHYLVNRHHPEHFGEESVRGMNLVDLIEMLCDWRAATERHADGDILKSIEINQKRFGYGDELKQILINTLEILEK